MFGDQGALFRDFILMETVNSVDAMSRGAAVELARRLALPRPPAFAQVLLPELSKDDEVLVANAQKLVSFLGASRSGSSAGSGLNAQTLQVCCSVLQCVAL